MDQNNTPTPEDKSPKEATILSSNDESKSSQKRKVFYSIVGIWALLLLAGFAYLQFAKKDEAGPTTQEIISQQEKMAQQARQDAQESQAKISNSSKVAVVGKQAPDFNLPGKDGRVKLSSFRGKKAVLVEFAASWCTHCRAEAPIIQQVLPKYPGVQMITVSAAREPNKVFEKWFDTFLGKPMIGLLAFDNTLVAAKEYGVKGYPTMAFIDKSGKLVDLTSGELSSQDLSSRLKELEG